jgi:hypothetical protein
MYCKHHENRRQNASKLFGIKHVHKNGGGDLDGPRVRKNYGGILDASQGQPAVRDANRMLMGSAQSMGLKRGGHAHLSSHKREMRKLHDTHSMKGFNHNFESRSHGSDAKVKRLASRAPHSNVKEMGMKAMSKDHFDFGREKSKVERRARFKEEPRAKFAVGGAGKIRLGQMTLSGKPIPPPGKRHGSRKFH